MNSNEGIVEVVQDQPEDALWQPVQGSVTMRLRDNFVASGAIPTQEGADRVVAEACGVLSQCAPPGRSCSNRSGLVCGYVQSGKTASMTAVSALAKDNGYRIIILIAGTTTNLVRQNRERLEKDLREAASE